MPECALIVGHPHAGGRAPLQRRHRCCAAGAVEALYCKHDLPNYDVFDERRYFTPDNRPLVFEVRGTRFGINICEDIWAATAPSCPRRSTDAPDAPRASSGAQVLLVPNASPFHLGKRQLRVDTMRTNVSRYRLPLVYANMVGGQDELVFDGASFVLDADGRVTQLAPQFTEQLMLTDFVDAVPVPATVDEPGSEEAQVYAALNVGVRDYIGKNGFPGVLLGLSGGIDSALTLAVAVDALGADRVRAVMMPSQYTADISWIDSREMVARLGVRYDELPIKPAFDAFLATLAQEFRGLPWDTTEENIQARIRGTLLMALSNKYGSIVLTTGNKSEMAVGYCTLYGDMGGGFAVIKDIRKTLVYRLADYRNALGEVIPQRIITRAPSAELRPDQTDQDSLPPYDVLDAIIEQYMERGASVREIVATGYNEADVRKVVRLIRINEYKRRQAPIGIRVTHRGFGRDWRYPVTNRFLEENGA
ncbi:MAG: NAD+ synthase [Burkholderiaceae bacterium]|nr:NAD+ synthase [Burkholderiaceae bacterium]